jgi:hypothetical protein
MGQLVTDSMFPVANPYSSQARLTSPRACHLSLGKDHGLRPVET